MVDFHTQEIDNDTRVRWVFDEMHETEGSYAYETEAETQAAERFELSKLESGEWVALGCIVEKRCGSCGNWDDTDSLWGIVIEPEGSELDAFAAHSMEGI